jgi:drug/metabolite transporter (DMT)-like permease
MDKARLAAIAQASSVLFLMSLGSVLMKIVLYDVKPLTFAWLSVGIGMITMSIYTFFIRRETIPFGFDRRIWLYIIAIGICNFALARISRPFALERLPVTTTTYVGNFIGFVTMGMSIFILREVPSIFQIIGAIIAFSGLRVYFSEAPTSYELTGILLIVVGIVAVAFTNNIARKLAVVTNNNISNNIISTLALLVGGTITVSLGLFLDWPPHVPTWSNWAIIIYSGVVMVGLGLTVWNHILRTLRSYEASILGGSTVIWTTLLAVLILGERPQVNQIAGIFLMLFGLILVQVRYGKLSSLKSYMASWQPVWFFPSSMRGSKRQKPSREDNIE